MTKTKPKDWLKYTFEQNILHPTKSGISLQEKESNAVN